MPTFRVPLTIKTTVSINADNAAYAEALVRKEAERHYNDNNPETEIDTDMPLVKSAYEVSITVFLDAFSTQEAEAAVFDLLGPVFNGNAKFGFDVDNIKKGEPCCEEVRKVVPY